MINTFLGKNSFDVLEGLGAFSIVTFFYLFCLAIVVVCYIALIKIFQKAGIAGWKAFIPFYNLYLLCEMVFGKGWLFFIACIPFVGSIFTYFLEYKLGRVFGKSTGFCILSVFFSPVTRMILAFGDSEYIGPVE